MASAAPAPPHWLDGPSRFRRAVGYHLALAIACLVSYWLITHILAHVYSFPYPTTSSVVCGL